MTSLKIVRNIVFISDTGEDIVFFFLWKKIKVAEKPVYKKIKFYPKIIPFFKKNISI